MPWLLLTDNLDDETLALNPDVERKVIKHLGWRDLDFKEGEERVAGVGFESWEMEAMRLQNRREKEDRDLIEFRFEC